MGTRPHRWHDGGRHPVALDAGRRTRNALGRRDAALLARGLSREVALRRRARLAGDVRGARPVLSRSGTTDRRRGRAGAAGARPARQPVPHAAAPADVQPRASSSGGPTSAGIAMWSQPSAKNSVAYRGRAVCCRNDTCAPVCPVGAKYSPDFTWNALRASRRVELVPRTLVRRLVVEDGSNRIARAEAVRRDRGGTNGSPRAFPCTDVRRRRGIRVEPASAAVVAERALPTAESRTGRGWSANT